MVPELLNLKSKDFVHFLKCLSRISDKAILEVSDKEVYSIVNSDDRSLFLWAKMDGVFGVDATLNLPSVTKLSDVIEMAGSPDVSLGILSNKLQYLGKSIKFDYHLHDDGIITKPKITLAKIKTLKYDYEFYVAKDFLKTLLKNSSVFKDTNKLYIYTEDDHLVWSLCDKMTQNTDSLTVEGGEVDFEMAPFIMKLDNFRLINFDNCLDFKFEINDTGIGCITLRFPGFVLNYIVTSLTN
jgi:hypothetical protein